MPDPPSRSLARQARLLSAIIKSIRLERRMKAAEVAAAMGLGLRTYEDFEAGRGRLDLEKIRRFASATDTDAAAITLGLLFNSRETALGAIDNKAATILWIGLREFEDEVGDELATIPCGYFLESLRHGFERLKDYLSRRDNSTERWLEGEIDRLYAASPRAASPPRE